MDRLRFLHIPKTAGFSFTECLSRLYPGTPFEFKGHLPIDIGRYHDQVAHPRQTPQLVIGHAPRITGISAIDVLPTITFFRDPIARVKSFCQHVSEGKSAYLREQYPPSHFDLDQFLDSGNGELFNLQTRTLLGCESYKLPEFDDQTIVAQAINVVQNELSGFGLVEDFETSVLLFRQSLSWKRWPLYRTLNKPNRTKLLTFRDHHIEKIRALNQLDCSLYEKSRLIFDQRVEQLTSLIEAQRLSFTQAQRRAPLELSLMTISRKVRRRLPRLLP